LIQLPDSPRLIGIPHDNWRQHQKEATEEAINAEEPVVAVQMPTGGGKSVSAVAIGQEHPPPATSVETRSLIATKTHQLQAQYLRDFGFLEDMKGRANFPCPNPEFKDAAECGECNACDGDCPYGDAKRAADAAPQIVTNYDYLAVAWPTRGSKVSALRQRDILLFDEGHLAEESIRASGGVTYTSPMLNFASMRRIPVPDTVDLATWGTFLGRCIEVLNQELEGRNIHDPEVAKRLRHELAFWRAARKGQGLLDGDEEVIVLKRGQNYAIEPIFAGLTFQNFVRGTTKIVLLSATLPAPRLTARLLGLRDSQFRSIIVPSTFPKETRPIYYRPVVNVSQRKMQGEDYQLLVNAIDSLLDAWTEEKGIIHAHAYWLQDAILNLTRHKDRLITHKARGLPDAVRRLESSGPGMFLLSPTAHSGVDLPYDHVRRQIICKLPTPDLGDRLVAARKSIIPETYDQAIVATLEQAYGRGNRAPDDYSNTVILDKNFGWHWKKNKHMYSTYFNEALHI